VADPETIRVNGAARPLRARSLAGLLEDLGLSTGSRGVAVAVNGSVVPRSGWDTVNLRAGDDVEVVGAVQGG
jgi:sulfur carrier protein